MNSIKQKIVPHLWFDSQAKEAVDFYVSIFSEKDKTAKINNISYYPKSAEEVSGKPAGSIMTVDFQILGLNILALNGGQPFKLSEAFSLIVNCKDQEEIDYYWEKLSEGGDESAQVCGWLRDKYGLSWQIVPENWAELVNEKDKEKYEKVFAAILKMKKIDIAKLKEAQNA